VSHMSVSGSAVFCTVLGLAGFLSFMNATKGDLLNNYCVDDWVATVARFLYASVIMLTFPIEIFVCREVLEIVLSRLPYKVVSWIPQGSVRTWFSRFLFSPRHTSLPRHVFLTISLVTGSLAVGLTTDDLGVVLGFTVSGIFVGGRAGVHWMSDGHAHGLHPPHGSVPAAHARGEWPLVLQGSSRCLGCHGVWSHRHGDWHGTLHRTGY
jgi:hypothetical protein